MTTDGPTRVDGAGLHVQSESNPWQVYLEDHAPRRSSHWFTAAKRTAARILATMGEDTYPYGPGPWEMHHGGSLWVLAQGRWRVFRARAGIEWSIQFCADPAKVERLRQDAQALVSAFPDTVPALRTLGYSDVDEVLTTPVTDAAGIERWTDGLFNSCLPLARQHHSAVLPAGAGEHHYPWPVKAADFVRHDDFQLWVALPGTTSFAAVVPVAPRGSGDGRVRLLYAPLGTDAGEVVTGQAEGRVPLAAGLAQLPGTAREVVLPADHPLALLAFARQGAGTGDVIDLTEHDRRP